MALKNVRIEPKPPKKRYEDSDIYGKSSDIVTYNLFEQEWDDLVREGLSHLFEERAEFEKRRSERTEVKCIKKLTEELTDTTEATEADAENVEAVGQPS